jgi:peptide/nickel transport system substrate-binding protein
MIQERMGGNMNLRARANLWIAMLSIFALVYAAACSSSETTTTTTTPDVTVATATPITAGDVVQRTTVADGRPLMTAELIERVPQMTAEEVLKYFPASYPKDFEDADIVKGGSFRLAVTSDISTWDTRISAAGGTTSIANCVYERFIQFQQGIGRDPNNPAIVGDMAHTWGFNDDGTQLTFHLNDNMYWGDPDDISAQGPKIVASDFVYTVTEYRDNSIHGGAYKTITNVEAPDDVTVIITFNSPSYFILPFLASKDGLQFNPHLAKDGTLAKRLSGPGPFRLTEAKKSIQMILDKNPNHFWKDESGYPLPYLDQIRFIVVPDATTRTAMFRTGKVHYAQTSGVDLRELQRLLQQVTGMQISASAEDGRGWVISPQLGGENPITADVNVRRAISLALDEKGISDVIWEGRGMPADPKYEWWHYRDTPPSFTEDLDAAWGPWLNHYDVEKAKSLWAEAGYGDITLEIPYYAYSAYIADMLSIAVDDMTKIGLKLKPQSQDYSAYNSKLQAHSQQDLILSWQQQAYDAVGTALTRLRSDGGGNREGVNDPELDALVDELVRAGDPVEQRRLVNELRNIYLDKAYFISFPDNGFTFRLMLQPEVRGIRGGQNAYLSYYYQGPILRTAWLAAK